MNTFPIISIEAIIMFIIYIMDNIQSKLCGKCNNTNNKPCLCKQVISPVVLNQGPYQGKPYKRIENIPNLEIAVLSNEFCDKHPTSTITLNPIVISWCDFLTLFYGANKNFVVSTSNIFNKCIIFSAQEYENVSKMMRYNLAEQVKSAWAQKHETLISNIPVKKSILLNKDTFLIRGLASACSSTALSLDEAMDVLINNNHIVGGCYNTEALVQFVVSYKYYYKPLDTCVQVNFLYLTKIPFFKNSIECGENTQPYNYYYNYNYYYSEECNSRNIIDTSQEDDALSFIKDCNFFLDDTCSSSNGENNGGCSIISNESSNW